MSKTEERLQGEATLAVPTSVRNPAEALASTRWPDESYIERLGERAVAVAVLQLLIRMQQWVHRRVESVVFQDGQSITRKVSIDFTVPEQAPVVRAGRDMPVRLVPLAVMRKKTLVNFDLRDEEGRAVPHLELRQNQMLSATLLLAWAEECLQERPGPALERDLRAIVAGDEQSRAAAYHRMRHAFWGDGDVEQRRVLHDCPAFGLVLEQLNGYFLLLVGIEGEFPDHRIIKVSYDEQRPSRRRLGPWARFSARMGWRPTTYVLPAPSVTNGQSYHLHVSAPEGVDIVDAILVAGHRDDHTLRGFTVCTRVGQTSRRRPRPSVVFPGPGLLPRHGSSAPGWLVVRPAA